MKYLSIVLMLLPFISEAKKIYKLDQAKIVHEQYLNSMLALPGVTSVGITACVSGVPYSLHSNPSLPEILPEACIQLTFDNLTNLRKARRKFGPNYQINDVTIFFGGISNHSPEPGITVHN